jgi:hypothetical protein
VTVRPKPARPRAPAPRRRFTPAGPTRAGRGTEAADATVAHSRISGSLPTTARPSRGGGGLSRGDDLFLVFFVATMIMVVAVVLVGAVGQLWVLVPVMLVDLIVTFAVIATLVSLLGDDGGPSA